MQQQRISQEAAAGSRCEVMRAWAMIVAGDGRGMIHEGGICGEGKLPRHAG